MKPQAHHGCTFARHMGLIDRLLIEEKEILVSWLEDFKMPEMDEEEEIEAVCFRELDFE